jgi:hypothetical protein
MKSLLRLWHHRRYTRNHTWYLDIGQRRLFVKASPNADEARQELAGRDMIADIYRVPALHRTGRAGAWTVHVYERSPHVADGLLLVDAIARAEATQNLTLLDRFLDDILVHYRTTILATARCIPGDQAVGKLYRHRAAPGGRLDEYYAARTPWPLPTGPWWPDGTEIFVNGTRRRPGLPQIIETLRSEIGTSALAWAAVTQGDPTDFNLAWSSSDGPVWFDYDTAGLNAIAGEFACFLMYQLLHGPRLTLRYDKAAFRDHPEALHHALSGRPAAHAERAGRTIALTYEAGPGPVRTHILQRYLTELMLPVAETVGVRDLSAWLRPYLLMRLLGVYNVTTLEPDDAALTLALAADLSDDATSIATVFPSLRTSSAEAVR